MNNILKWGFYKFGLLAVFTCSLLFFIDIMCLEAQLPTGYPTEPLSLNLFSTAFDNSFQPNAFTSSFGVTPTGTNFGISPIGFNFGIPLTGFGFGGTSDFFLNQSFLSPGLNTRTFSTDYGFGQQPSNFFPNQTHTGYNPTQIPFGFFEPTNGLNFGMGPMASGFGMGPMAPGFGMPLMAPGFGMPPMPPGFGMPPLGNGFGMQPLNFFPNQNNMAAGTGQIPFGYNQPINNFGYSQYGNFDTNQFYSQYDTPSNQSTTTNSQIPDMKGTYIGTLKYYNIVENDPNDVATTEEILVDICELLIKIETQSPPESPFESFQTVFLGGMVEDLYLKNPGDLAPSWFIDNISSYDTAQLTNSTFIQFTSDNSFRSGFIRINFLTDDSPPSLIFSFDWTIYKMKGESPKNFDGTVVVRGPLGELWTGLKLKISEFTST